jgi:hypothetical protein
MEPLEILVVATVLLVVLAVVVALLQSDTAELLELALEALD